MFRLAPHSCGDLVGGGTGLRGMGPASGVWSPGAGRERAPLEGPALLNMGAALRWDDGTDDTGRPRGCDKLKTVTMNFIVFLLVGLVVRGDGYHREPFSLSQLNRLTGRRAVQQLTKESRRVRITDLDSPGVD